MKNRKKLKTYGLYVVGMVVLVIISFFLPQIVFLIQDRYQMKSTEVKERTSLNTSQIDVSYEEKMNKRMKNLITMNLDSAIVTVVEPDFETDAEMTELVESILSQDWITVFIGSIFSYDDIGVFQGENTPMEISECKKYMVYNEDYQEGIALMMWYFDVHIPNIGLRIRLLADSETNSIYYIRLKNELSESDVKSGKNTSMQTVDYSSEEIIKTLYERAVLFQYCMTYYGFYYEADMESLEGFGDEQWWNTGEMQYAGIEVEDAKCMAYCLLPYGEISTDFQLLVSYESAPEFSMGIPIIANLIPEMIQD